MKKWTKEEENLLRRAVLDSPENLALAFRAAAEVLDRTPDACAKHWYKLKTKPEQTLSLMSYTPKPKSSSFWERIKQLFL